MLSVETRDEILVIHITDAGKAVSVPLDRNGGMEESRKAFAQAIETMDGFQARWFDQLVAAYRPQFKFPLGPAKPFDYRSFL